TRRVWRSLSLRPETRRRSAKFIAETPTEMGVASKAGATRNFTHREIRILSYQLCRVCHPKPPQPPHRTHTVPAVEMPRQRIDRSTGSTRHVGDPELLRHALDRHLINTF